MKKITIDKDKCVTCHACELVCSFEKRVEFNLKYSAIKIEITDRLSGDFQMLVCRQCRKPACVEACNEGALSLRNHEEHEEKGYIDFREDRCIACGKCIKVCPFSAIFADPVANKPLRCDLCGGDPRCVLYCQKEALSVV